jgi:hypothetical protein
MKALLLCFSDGSEGLLGFEKVLIKYGTSAAREGSTR